MEITLSTIRESLSSAVISDALDGLGYSNQSPRVQLNPVTGIPFLVGRCRTLLWEDVAYADPRPYELELHAVDACRPDDVIVAAAAGSTRSALWGELLSEAARNAVASAQSSTARFATCVK